MLLSELSVGLIHGRLKPKEKVQMMQAFKAGEINLLVATTVIEVGVDVPNASLMIIENPNVWACLNCTSCAGESAVAAQSSHCVLLYSAPLSGNGAARLKIMRETNDGFKIAEKDLEIRGPGEVLGTRQTGDMQFRIADLQRDAHLLPEVKRMANLYCMNTRQCGSSLIARWLGHSEQYGQA